MNSGREGVAAERGQTGAAPIDDESGGWLLPTLILIALGALAGWALFIAARRRRLRALGPHQLAEAQLSELQRTLLRLGWDLPRTTTLLALERRLGRFAGPSCEAYAGALRATRYDPREPEGPELSRRRQVRRELSRGSLRDRFMALIAMPPGGPKA